MLRRQGVKVPEVVYFEPFDASIQRSAMLTTEIRGEHISQTSIGTEMSTILREAGRDLAIINDIPVEGFGWIRRDQHDETKLEAEHPSFQDFIFEHLDADLALLGAQVLTADETAATRTLIEQASALFPPGQAWLAHGDLDVTHIFQEHGRYTGIIDFGEIRGAGRVYDLGHFNLHDGERLNQRILHFLLEGYQEITALPPDYEWQIQVTSLMIGIRALARAMLRPPSNYRHSLTTAIRSLIKGLDSVELFRPGL
jgi:aminoglycoside phosphotransferase (APT) family kinase protein